MAVHDGTLQGAEPAWPLLLAPSTSSGHVWTTGRYHLDRKRTTLELQLWRPDAAGPESHALPIEAREGGVCHLVVEVLPEGVRSDACSYWTPTYRGWPH
jgi:hypothetical protein